MKKHHTLIIITLTILLACIITWGVLTGWKFIPTPVTPTPTPPCPGPDPCPPCPGPGPCPPGPADKFCKPFALDDHNVPDDECMQYLKNGQVTLPVGKSCQLSCDTGYSPVAGQGKDAGLYTCTLRDGKALLQTNSLMCGKTCSFVPTDTVINKDCDSTTNPGAECNLSCVDNFTGSPKFVCPSEKDDLYYGIGKISGDCVSDCKVTSGKYYFKKYGNADGTCCVRNLFDYDLITSGEITSGKVLVDNSNLQNLKKLTLAPMDNKKKSVSSLLMKYGNNPGLMLLFSQKNNYSQYNVTKHAYDNSSGTWEFSLTTNSSNGNLSVNDKPSVTILTSEPLYLSSNLNLSTSPTKWDVKVCSKGNINISHKGKYLQCSAGSLGAQCSLVGNSGCQESDWQSWQLSKNENMCVIKHTADGGANNYLVYVKDDSSRGDLHLSKTVDNFARWELIPVS
jgi:hypothetical protein